MATNFYLESRTDKRGDAPIRVSISIGGARFVTSSGEKISPDKWNADKQRVKKGSTNARGRSYTAINEALQNICSHFAAFESECITKGIAIDVDSIKREYSLAIGRSKATPDNAVEQISFYDCFDLFVQQTSRQNDWTYRTEQKFNTLKNHLTSFDNAITFDSLNEAKLSSFIDFLRLKKDLVNSTIAKQIALLKWFLRWAISKGYTQNAAFASFAPKLKTSGKRVIFLEWAELMRVYNFDIPANGIDVNLIDGSGREYAKTIHESSALNKTRDIFCFCCFTSLRYSDASNLKWSNVNGDSITLTTIKTADTITIELNKYALAILEKYKSQAPENGGYVFPNITNQRMNVYLKELCELCGINQLITQTYYKGNERIDETLPKYELIGTHAGRRTFICNALMLGISPEIVMKWTGHSDYKAMKPYIDIADAAKAKAMDLFNNI